jgi:TonB family protein
MACVGLSIFAHVASLLFLFLVAARELAPPGELELDSELVRKFLIVPPPELEDPSRKAGGTELEDPGLRDRDEMGGKRAEREEVRVGKRDAQQPNTEIAGDPQDAVAQKVRGLGLLGVLSGGSGAVTNALDTPSLDSLLGGLGAVETVIGQGSGGMGLRGSGSGGGGKGPGTIFGAGDLGTGVAGGKGLGKGKGGIGTSGRQAREVSLSLGGDQAKVSGFLSAEQINRVVRANQAAIKYCYENALQRQSGLQGAVHIHWRIALSGAVTTARVEKSTLGNAKVEGCIVRQVKRWRFPQPDGGEVAVTYPFFFGRK